MSGAAAAGGAGASAEAEGPKTWFGEAAVAFRKLKPDLEAGRGLNTTLLVAASRKIAESYDHMFSAGIVVNALKKDCDANTGGVERHHLATGSKHETVQQLVEAELAERGVDAVRRDKESATLCALWMLRALSFVSRFMQLIAEGGPKGDPSVAAREVYGEVLRPYHGLLLSGVVSMALRMAPSREGLFRSMGCTEAEAAPELPLFVRDVLPVVDALRAWYDAKGLNFPDKA